MRFGQFLFTILIALVLLALIGLVDWDMVGSWGIFMLILALIGPVFLIVSHLVMKLKEKKNDEAINKKLGVFFNWVIVISGFVIFILIVSSQTDTSTSYEKQIPIKEQNRLEQAEQQPKEDEPIKTKATNMNAVQEGYYISLFSGWKSTGPSRHEWLVSEIKKVLNTSRYEVSCIEGLDQTNYSSIEIEEYRQKNPQFIKTQDCDESSEVFIGPFENEGNMKNFFTENNIGDIDLHLYESYYVCNYTCKELN
jgi:hypothetical protein